MTTCAQDMETVALAVKVQQLDYDAGLPWRGCLGGAARASLCAAEYPKRMKHRAGVLAVALAKCTGGPTKNFFLLIKEAL